MRNHFLFLMILFLSVFSTAADNAPIYVGPNEVLGRIMDYGIIGSDITQNEYAIPGTGRTATVASLSIAQTTDEIPFQKDVSFGIVWSAIGFTSDEKQKITFRVEHPPMRLPNGKTVTSEEEVIIIHPMGGFYVSTDGYSLTEDFEMVQGQWTFSVFHEGNVIVTKSFQIVSKAH